MGNPGNAALAAAKKVSDDAAKFSGSVTHQAGNKTDPTAPKPAPSDYSHVHTARKTAAASAPKAPTTFDELDAKNANISNDATRSPQ